MANKSNNSHKKEKKKPKQPNSKSSQKGAAKKNKWSYSEGSSSLEENIFSNSITDSSDISSGSVGESQYKV